MNNFDDMFGKLNNTHVETVMAMLRDVTNDTYVLEETGLEVINQNENMIIPLEMITEILRTKEMIIHEFSTTNPHVRGMIHVRGEWLPVVHMKWCQHKHTHCKHMKCNNIIVVNYQDQDFGFLVQEILGLKKSDEKDNIYDFDLLFERTD